MIDLHYTGEDQAVDLRAQTANVGGEFEGQHGHGAIGEIDAGAAQAGFVVERGAWRDIVGDVGNVHLKLEVTVVEEADGDGVVEVARGFAVDGHDGELAEVATGAGLGGGNGRLDGLRFGQNFSRKMVREVKLANDDFDVHTEVVFVADDLDDLTAGILGGARPVGDFDVDHDVFEIVPVGAAGSFFAQHAMRTVLSMWPFEFGD